MNESVANDYGDGRVPLSGNRDVSSIRRDEAERVTGLVLKTAEGCEVSETSGCSLGAIAIRDGGQQRVMVSPHHSVGDAQQPYALLAEPRRRHTLRALSDTDSPLALADVAAEISAHEQPTATETPDWDNIKRIYVALYHCHIPKLEDAGLVEFNMARRTVALAGSLSPTLRAKLAP